MTILVSAPLKQPPRGLIGEILISRQKEEAIIMISPYTDFRVFVF